MNEPKANNNNNLPIQQGSLDSQDGKRTLIKNQLYLIEQLQLENANLRNERDQLQLENEELKFQLQMISSSNILSQPGATFSSNNNSSSSNKQAALDRNNHLPHQIAPCNNNSSKSIVENVGETSYINNNNTVPDNNRIQNQIKLLATPLRQPHISSTSLKSSTATPLSSKTPSRIILDNSNLDNQQQPVLTRAKTTTNVVEHSKLGLNQYYQQHEQQNQNQQQPVRLKSAASLTDCTKLATGARTSEPLLIGNKFSIAGQSTSLTAFNVKNLADNKSGLVPQSRNLPQDDEEQRVKLVVQRYGSDCDKIQASAVIIQRAFRKYQICKRFRTITEQLRLNSSTSSTETSGISLSINTSDSLSSSNTKQSDESTTDLPFASGTTRAAALESLSYAASRLAVAAAKQQQQQASNLSATSTNQQTKQSSHLQSQARLANSLQKTGQSQATTTNPLTAPIVRNQQDPVVTAAINFQQLESIRKRQYRVGLNIFNKNPEKGVSFLIAHSFIDSSSPYTKTSTSYYHSNQLHFIDSKQNHHHQLAQQLALPNNATGLKDIKHSLQICQTCVEEDNLKKNIAHFLLHRKGLAKEKIGAYLGNLQSKFNQDVLKYYLQELDFAGLQIDLALRKFLSTFRLPGEAQKIEAIVDQFAQRYVQCQQIQQQLIVNGLSNETNINPTITPVSNQIEVVTSNYKNNHILLSKDEIFILTFAIIMLNTDLHSPSLKPTSRMSSPQFVNNLRGVFKSQNINETDLMEIYERVKANQITTTPDHVTHVMKVQQGLTVTNFQRKELPNLCVPHRRLVCFCRLFEVYDVNKKERIGQHQREIFLFNDLLLVTKLVRRVRTNTNQLYTYRQSISLQGLYVQLFQSPHYNYGMKLCQRSNDETLIMFNARNELDQSRFVEDLGESIAEMDEMENMKVHNIVDTIHFKYQERLRRHSVLHNNNSSSVGSIIKPDSVDDQQQKNRLFNNMIKSCDIRISNSKQQQQQHQVPIDEMKENEILEESKKKRDVDRMTMKQNAIEDLVLQPEEQPEEVEQEEEEDGGQDEGDEDDDDDDEELAAGEEPSLNNEHKQHQKIIPPTPEPVTFN